METALIVFLSMPFAMVVGRPEYQALIPNGNKVPSPCPDGGLWPGVGHEAQAGGGPRNPFGIEFFNNNKKWTVELCQKDSDGDGLTNGMELGDPSCQWTEGATPSKTTNLTHPGICEPLTASACHGRNNFLPANCLPSTTLLPSTTTYFGPSTNPGSFGSSVSTIEGGAGPQPTVKTTVTGSTSVYMGQFPEQTTSSSDSVRVRTFLKTTKALLAMISFWLIMVR